MRTIAIVNHKGGVGKTTTTLNMGAELARNGYKVLLVDFDMQGNLTTGCGIDTEKADRTIADGINALLNDTQPNYENIIKPTTISENIDCVPCGLELADTLLTLQNTAARETYLGEFLAGLEEQYDICLIDCAPSIMIDFQNVLYGADDILIVTSPNTFSANGIVSLIENYIRFQKIRIRKYRLEPLNIAGILINNVEANTRLHRDMYKQIHEVYSELYVFQSFIPKTIKVAESAGSGKSIRMTDPNNPASAAYEAACEELIERLKNA